MKINGIKVVKDKTGDNNNALDFRYIFNDANKEIDWEASFLLEPGSHNILLYSKVWDNSGERQSQTSGTAKITGLNLMVVPKYLLGGIFALAVCFATFIAFTRLPKTKNRKP